MIKDKILYEIDRWTSRLERKRDSLLFIVMKNIIEGKKTHIDFNELFEENDSSKKVNPQKSKDIISQLNNELDKIFENINDN